MKTKHYCTANLNSCVPDNCFYWCTGVLFPLNFSGKRNVCHGLSQKQHLNSKFVFCCSRSKSQLFATITQFINGNDDFRFRLLIFLPLLLSFFTFIRFQRACTLYGVPDVDLFQTTDLFDYKNIALVTQTIFAIGRAVSVRIVSLFALNVRTNNLFAFIADIQTSRIQRTTLGTTPIRRKSTSIFWRNIASKWSDHRLASRFKSWCQSIWS